MLDRRQPEHKRRQPQRVLEERQPECKRRQAGPVLRKMQPKQRLKERQLELMLDDIHPQQIPEEQREKIVVLKMQSLQGRQPRHLLEIQLQQPWFRKDCSTK